ncbi:MAG: hypothetical protein OXU20_41615 [Myxococcales bacterium]|nr:hypothetical protein [Myxococcales bacterium]
MRLVDAPAQASTPSTNTSIAQLQAWSPDQSTLPGYIFNFDLWKKGYLDIRHPDVYLGSNRPVGVHAR